MTQPDIDAEMGLDGLASISPGEWVLDLLVRLQKSTRWIVDEAIVGAEDNEDAERISLGPSLEIASPVRKLLLASDQCSCFLTVSDQEGTWAVPLMFTKGAKTVLTASIYDSDLRSGTSVWMRVNSLRDLCVDLLFRVDTSKWLGFGIEAEEIGSVGSTIFLVLSEGVWESIPETTRSCLAPLVEEHPGCCTLWFLPRPGVESPCELEKHLTAVAIAIETA